MQHKSKILGTRTNVHSAVGPRPSKEMSSALEPLSVRGEGTYRHGQSHALVVDALVELSAEELHAHDGEDEPEHEAHQQHVEDGGDGEHEGVHDDLRTAQAPTLAVLVSECADEPAGEKLSLFDELAEQPNKTIPVYVKIFCCKGNCSPFQHDFIRDSSLGAVRNPNQKVSRSYELYCGKC